MLWLFRDFTSFGQRKICVYTKSALYLFNINQIKKKKNLQKMFIGPYQMIDIKKNVLRKNSFRCCKINLIYEFYNCTIICASLLIAPELKVHIY